jgi:HAD superfamily hydrolase (TIGR01549 family)
MKYDYIFFDSGGTLYGHCSSADPSPEQVAAGSVDRVYALLGVMGVNLNLGRVSEALVQQAKNCHQRLGEAYNYHQLIIAVLDELDLPLGAEAAACLADAYAGPRYASWLFPGTVDALRTLSEKGFRLGIIANTEWPGFSMDRAFAGVGLQPYLGTRVYSGDIGIEKPDPAIFHFAERLAGIEGKRILYVGNDIEADIKGAANVGWSTAFRRSGNSTTEGLADIEFDEISELVRHCMDY